MDEGAVNEGIVNEEEVIEVIDEVKNEDDRDKGGVMDEKVRDEDVEVWDKEDSNERVIDEEEVRNEGVGAVGDEAVEVPINIKWHCNYINEHTLYLSLMY